MRSARRCSCHDSGGTMGWEPLKRAMRGFDEFVARQDVRIASDAAINPQLAIVRQFLDDHESMGGEGAADKWVKNDFKLFYDAVIAVYRLTDVVVTLCDSPAHLRSRLTTVLSGPLTQDWSPQPAKDILYELEIAAALRKAGFDVALREPDVVVSGGELTEEIGLACKYPSSEAQIHAHITKGYRQIAKQDLRGCVVLGLDLIIHPSTFDSSPQFVDLSQSVRHPRDVANEVVADAMSPLVANRSKDYPSERPLDGAILTFGTWGIFGQPRGFASLMAWSVQCLTQNPIRGDLELIVRRMKELNTELKSL